MEHEIFRFAKMILFDRCSTSYDLASLFSWQAQYFRQMEWTNRKTHWYQAVSFVLSFPFLKEVSQTCFVFDVVNLSRTIASFWMLSSSKTEEVSQNCFVLDVVKFKN